MVMIFLEYRILQSRNLDLRPKKQIVPGCWSKKDCFQISKTSSLKFLLLHNANFPQYESMIS